MIQFGISASDYKELHKYSLAAKTQSVLDTVQEMISEDFGFRRHLINFCFFFPHELCEDGENLTEDGEYAIRYPLFATSLAYIAYACFEVYGVLYEIKSGRITVIENDVDVRSHRYVERHADPHNDPIRDEALGGRRLAGCLV